MSPTNIFSHENILTVISKTFSILLCPFKVRPYLHLLAATDLLSYFISVGSYHVLSFVSDFLRLPRSPLFIVFPLTLLVLGHWIPLQVESDDAVIPFNFSLLGRFTQRAGHLTPTATLSYSLSIDGLWRQTDRWFESQPFHLLTTCSRAGLTSPGPGVLTSEVGMIIV